MKNLHLLLLAENAVFTGTKVLCRPGLNEILQINGASGWTSYVYSKEERTKELSCHRFREDDLIGGRGWVGRGAEGEF